MIKPMYFKKKAEIQLYRSFHNSQARSGLMYLCLWVILFVSGCWVVPTPTPTPPSSTAHTENHSTETQCAEEDDVNVPFFGNISSFIIEATHPTYPVIMDSCASDFTNCPASEGPDYPFSPSAIKLYDDGETVVEAIREASWWRPNGMAVSVNNGDPAVDIHYLRLYRKINDANEWPQFLILYMDGNLRLIPHPPKGTTSVCFGSSVIVGPAAPATRPIAEITSAIYRSSSKTIEITYKDGGSATLNPLIVSRTLAQIRVDIHYPTDVLPFATFRSMFVTQGNADVDHVKWKDLRDVVHDDAIMDFPVGSGREWFFYRSEWSKHNTSAPDIRIRLERYIP